MRQMRYARNSSEVNKLIKFLFLHVRHRNAYVRKIHEQVESYACNSNLTHTSQKVCMKNICEHFEDTCREIPRKMNRRAQGEIHV